jgi:heat shock protein beta
MIGNIDWERLFVVCFEAKTEYVLNTCFYIYNIFSATLRSGFMLKDTSDFAESVELMMRKTLGISLEEQVS